MLGGERGIKPAKYSGRAECRKYLFDPTDLYSDKT